MLAREDRNRFFGHVVALFQNLFVDHGEPIADELRILVGNVQIEVVGLGLPALQNDRAGYHVTGCQLQPLVIAVHEPLLLAVE